MIKWTEEKLDWLRKNLHKTNREIGEELGLSKSAITNILHIKGIKRQPELRESLRKLSQFKPGHVGYKPLKGVRVSIRTEFKPGQKPTNTKWDGCVTIRNETLGRKVVMIRISENSWVYLSRYNYMKEYGYIPKGWIITHKDGNSLNCNIENLKAMPRKSLMVKNHNRIKAIITRSFGKAYTEELAAIPEVVEFIKKRTELGKCLNK